MTAELLQGALDRVDVQQHDGGAVDLAVQGNVGADAQGVPVPLPVLHLRLQRGQGVDDGGDQPGQVLDLEVGLDVADRPAQVGGDEVEELLGGGGEAADAEVAADQDQGDVDPGEQVDQVVVDPGQLGVAVP